jgi:pimeloyl-ACP methyl ester carboxylesterase
MHARHALAAVLLYRLVSFWLVALAGWLVVLWLRHPWRHAAASARPAAATAPDATAAHELVLLHGQPGSADDWHEVIARLPTRLHAVAVDRPGYGSSGIPAGGFAANARAVLADLDARGVDRAVLVGHSWGGGVALSAARLAPDRVAAVVLLASVGPGSVTGWDRLLAAPGAGPLLSRVAWQWTPWIARDRLAHLQRRRGGPPGPSEFVNWQVWGHADNGSTPLWRTFLAEQRALLHELDDLDAALGSVRAPVLLLADPADHIVPFDTARRLAHALPDARLQPTPGVGHHLPRRAPGIVADAIVTFLAALDEDQPSSERYRSTARVTRSVSPVASKSSIAPRSTASSTVRSASVPGGWLSASRSSQSRTVSRPKSAHGPGSPSSDRA